MEKDRLEKWRFSWRDPATGRTRRRTFPSESERDAFAATTPYGVWNVEHVSALI